jgi:hypothetical protein
MEQQLEFSFMNDIYMSEISQHSLFRFKSILFDIKIKSRELYPFELKELISLAKWINEEDIY